MTHPWKLAAVLLLAATLAGCSGSGLTEIHGTVTLDGEAIENGTIRFEALDKRTPSAQAVIKDGAYRVEVAPGMKRVEIQGYRVIGQKRRNDDPSAPLEDVTEPYVPARFNTNSELTREISSATDTYNFAVTTAQ